MISRIKMHNSGLSVYLLNGKRKDSEYSRVEKDNVIPLYGSLDILKKAEEFTNRHKNWKYNYEHITISFNKEDMNRLDLLGDNKRNEVLRDIAQMMIKHRTSGYDLGNEVIAYSEAHQPKIKREFNKERLEHIHIGISYLNPLNNTKLKTTFYNNSYISDTIDKYISKKHNLTFVRPNKNKDRLDDYRNDTRTLREKFKDVVLNMNDVNDLIDYFNNNDIKFKEVKTKFKGTNKINNHYLVCKIDNLDIRCRGKGFENVSYVEKGKYLKELEDKSLQELEKILKTYYKTRIKLIDDRRSKETKKVIEKIYEKNVEDNINSIYNMTYQQKIFYKHYGHLFEDRLKGFYIDVKDKNEVKIINKDKDIHIIDSGDKVISKDTKNMKETVRLMLDICLSKGWKLENMVANGNYQFKKEVNKQICEKLKMEKTEKQKNIEKEIINNTLKRPTTPTQKLKQELTNAQQLKDSEKDISLNNLKNLLDSQKVLDFAVRKYKLNKEDYETTDDNKINNLNNRQKPKNVIDFFCKECGLDIKESINICKNLLDGYEFNIDTPIKPKLEKELSPEPRPTNTTIRI